MTQSLQVYILGHLGRIQTGRPALSRRPSPHHFRWLLTASSACSSERTPGGKHKERLWGRERERENGGGGGVKVKLSPLKLVEETASPFWVWSITFAGHHKKRKEKKGKSLSSELICCAAESTCCFANWAEDGGGLARWRGQQRGNGNSHLCSSSHTLSLHAATPALLPSPSPSISFSLPLSFQSSCFPFPCWHSQTPSRKALLT